MNENFNYCNVVGKTDVGRKRAANEDNMNNAITQNGLVSVVCDGMGGHVGGATASSIAVSTIMENLNNVYYEDPRIAIGESIDRANRAIIQKTKEHPELTGMGSTCVLLIVRGGKVYIGHVGDSRIYLVRSKKIVQLTKDHSYVQMLVDCGEITKAQAEHHPRKNEITNALGIPNMSPATVVDDAIIPEAGDCFVLCSDGLSGMVSDDNISKIISRQSEMNAQERVDRLVALANENGGLDNITVQLVEFSISPNVITKGKKYSTLTKIIFVISILVAIGIGGFLWLREKPGKIINDSNQPISYDYCYEKKIPFEKNADIVELVFSDSVLVFKREGEQIDKIDASFDQKSLNVETPDVKTQFNNSLLSFTDKNPGDIVFYITQSDKTHVYRCKFEVLDDVNGKSSTNIDEKKSFEVGGNNPNNKIKEETIVKTDTITFEYKQIEKGTKLLLNYSAKPKLIFNEIVKKVGNTDLGEIREDLSYDNKNWDVERKKGQLSFTYKGETSENTYTFVIPCVVKNSKGQLIIIYIKLVPKNIKVDTNAPVKGSKDKNYIKKE